MTIFLIIVYNENDDDFYIHHDIYLAASPLCMEWVGYDTEKSSLGIFHQFFS